MQHFDYPATRRKKKSHWITFSIFSSAIGAYLFELVFSLPWMVSLPLLFLVIYALGRAFDPFTVRLYYFIRWAFKGVFQIAENFILYVIFYGFLYVMGLFGSKLDMNALNRATGWHTYLDHENKELDFSGKNFISWGFKSGNWWIIFLYPYLLLLKIYRVQKPDTSVPTDTYTLY